MRARMAGNAPFPCAMRYNKNKSTKRAHDDHRNSFVGGRLARGAAVKGEVSGAYWPREAIVRKELDRLLGGRAKGKGPSAPRNGTGEADGALLREMNRLRDMERRQR